MEKNDHFRYENSRFWCTFRGLADTPLGGPSAKFASLTERQLHRRFDLSITKIKGRDFCLVLLFWCTK